jgi:hypothetical protein
MTSLVKTPPCHGRGCGFELFYSTKITTNLPNYGKSAVETPISLGKRRPLKAGAPAETIRVLDAPERQFVDFRALRTPFDLGWHCTLRVVALTTDRERRAGLWVKNGDHLPGEIAKKFVIGLIAVCRQLT